VSVTSVMNMCPGAWVIAKGGRDAISAVWVVTPQAQNTGTSPGAAIDGVTDVWMVEVGDAERGRIPRVDWSAVGGWHASAHLYHGVDLAGGDRALETTSRPWRRPAGRHSQLVTYMATLRPCSTCRSGTPASTSAVSKVKLQPMRKATMSSRHRSATSVGSPTSWPCSQTL
jgi:hypothetical protein